jgi:hypothetical protein
MTRFSGPKRRRECEAEVPVSVLAREGIAAICEPLWYRKNPRFRASGSERGGWTKWGQAGACPLDRSTARIESIVREVEVRLDTKLADPMTELRVWLDHNNYVPVSFEICKERQPSVLVRVVFSNLIWPTCLSRSSSVDDLRGFTGKIYPPSTLRDRRMRKRTPVPLLRC